MLNETIRMNETAGVMANFTDSDETYKNYVRVKLASAVILVLLSPLTVAANSLLLTAIYKDPLRCFRTPTTYFIVGLALSDLFTGLLVEPFFILKYIVHYKHCGWKIACKTPDIFHALYRAGGIISTIAISSSFMVVLALSISQYIAVTFPHKYKKIVTKYRAIWIVGLSWLYFIGFSLLQFSGINMYTYLQIDLFLHASLISILLAIIHALLYFSFRRHLSRRYTWRRRSFYAKNDSQRKGSSKEKSRLNDRQFTIVTFYLAGILLASATSHSVVLYVYFYHKNRSYEAEIDIHIFLRISDMMLFLKVALDPFIYAWRLPTYRKALKHTLVTQTRQCLSNQKDGRLTFLMMQELSRKKEQTTG